jgi:hypothetical protein
MAADWLFPQTSDLIQLALFGLRDVPVSLEREQVDTEK